MEIKGKIQMKRFDEYIHEATGSLFNLKDTKDFNNPRVQIKGVGNLPLNTLKREIANKIKDLGKRASKGDFSFVRKQITDSSEILHTYLKALDDVERELQTPKVKAFITKKRLRKEERESLLDEINSLPLGNKMSFKGHRNKRSVVLELTKVAHNLFENPDLPKNRSKFVVKEENEKVALVSFISGRVMLENVEVTDENI